MRFRRFIAWSALFAAMPLAGARAGLPEHFTLSKYIPDDVWLYMHGVQTTETEWIHEQWGRVCTAFGESGIAGDLVGLVLSMAPAEERAVLQARIESGRELISAVNWSDIFGGKEFAFAERGSTTTLGYDYFLLSRSSPESAQANYQAIARIIQHIGAASPRIRVGTQDALGTQTQVLFLGAGLRLTVFCKNDVLAIVTGKPAVRDVIRRIDRHPSARSICDLPRFQSALDKVPAADVQISYIDIRMLMQDIITQMKGDQFRKPYGELPPAILQAQDVARQFDVFDYFISTSTFANQRQTTRMYGRIQEGRENQPFARVLSDRKPFEQFDRYIPAKATSFSLNAMVNLEHLYNGIVDYMRNKAPNGPQLLQRWDTVLSQLGFHPQRDLFDWWSGETISISLPAAMITPMSREDFVLMIRVKDTELASQKVNGLLDTTAALFKGQGQMLSLQPAKVKAEGFRQITHPMLTMFMQPVVGVHDGWLMIGSSAAAVNQCLAVAAGDAPSIRTNKRFAAEGLVPDGPVESVFFTDTSRFGEELAEAVGMVGIVSGMLPMLNVHMQVDGAEKENNMPLADLVRSAMPIIGKLGPVLREIDFYSSDSGITKFDGAAWHDQRVTVYKSPSTLEENRLARTKTGP